MKVADEIVIAKTGKSVASPAVAADSKTRVPGVDKGKIWMAKDFNVMSNRELDDWYPATRS
jgi:hypothetical protein